MAPPVLPLVGAVLAFVIEGGLQAGNDGILDLNAGAKLRHLGSVTEGTVTVTPQWWIPVIGFR